MLDEGGWGQGRPRPGAPVFVCDRGEFAWADACAEELVDGPRPDASLAGCGRGGVEQLGEGAEERAAGKLGGRGFAR